MNYVDTMEYDSEFKIISRWFAQGDSFMAEELRNEMHLAILRMPAEKPRSYYIVKAKGKAIDYLRSRKMNYSYGDVFKHISLEALLAAGFRFDLDGNVYKPKADTRIDIGGSDDG